MEKVAHVLLLLVALPWLLQAESLTNAFGALGRFLMEPGIILPPGGNKNFWSGSRNGFVSGGVSGAVLLDHALENCLLAAWAEHVNGFSHQFCPGLTLFPCMGSKWLVDSRHQPLRAESLRDRDWNHRVVQHTCMMQLQQHGHEIHFPLLGHA